MQSPQVTKVELKMQQNVEESNQVIVPQKVELKSNLKKDSQP